MINQVNKATHGPARILMNVAGIGTAKRLIGKDGTPMPLEDFRRVIEVDLIGTFNVTRLAVAGMVKLDALDDGERGVVVNTASVAAFDGQVGQEAYAASKGGVVSLTLPLARDLAQFGVRVVTIAPGLFLTPLMAELPQVVQDSLAASLPFPKRLGKPEEFAHLAATIVENMALQRRSDPARRRIAHGAAVRCRKTSHSPQSAPRAGLRPPPVGGARKVAKPHFLVSAGVCGVGQRSRRERFFLCLLCANTVHSTPLR